MDFANCCKCGEDFPYSTKKIWPIGERNPSKQKYICPKCYAVEWDRKKDKARARAEKRQERVKENAVLAGKTQSACVGEPCGVCDLCVNGHQGCYSPVAPKSTAKGSPRRQKRKKAPSRKSLVRKADTAFSLHIRALYPTSFFSGKPTECCFHIITRSKHSVRWALDNAVGSTMGENYEMEFNPHKFINMLIESRGLPWYQALVRRSNEIRKHTREDLEAIAARGYE